MGAGVFDGVEHVASYGLADGGGCEASTVLLVCEDDEFGAGERVAYGHAHPFGPPSDACCRAAVGAACDLVAVVVLAGVSHGAVARCDGARAEREAWAVVPEDDVGDGFGAVFHLLECVGGAGVGGEVVGVVA